MGRRPGESDRGDLAEAPALTKTGVLVRVTGPDPKGIKADGRPFYSMEAGKTTLSASGFLCPCGAVAEGWAVVTSAMLFAPFMKLHEVTQEPLEELMANCTVEMLLESGAWTRCELATIVRCKEVTEAGTRLANWRAQSVRGIDVGCIALLRAPGVSAAPAPLVRVPDIPTSRELVRGEGVMVVCSPFGLVSPAVFQNSLTTGVISNVVRSFVAQEQSSLYLTDARCLPGSEGGAVFDASGHVIGMIAPSLQRMDQSNVELGAIIPWRVFAPALALDLLPDGPATATDGSDEGPGEHATRYADNGIFAQETACEGAHAVARESAGNELLAAGAPLPLRATAPHQKQFIPKLSSAEEAVKCAAASVVLIQVNTSWGSGIIVSEEGHIVSCAHLFRPFTQVNPQTKRLQMRHAKTRIRVSFRDHSRRVECSARLIFCSRGAVDVALLQLVGPTRDLCPPPVPLLPEGMPIPGPGQACVAMGHAIFDPSTQLQATVSAGVVSRIVPSPSQPREPAIVQTCASVFRGHSGGLLADSYGRFIGVLTSNARHSNGSIIPEINFVIPIHVLRPLLAAIPKDPSVQAMIFDTYDRPDPTLLSLWRLEAGASPPENEACEIQGYDSGECRDPDDFQAEMSFCSDLVTYRACMPRYQGSSVSRWSEHSVRTKDAWVEETFQKEWGIRKTAETNLTLQELGVDENGDEGSVVMRFYAEGEEDAWNFMNECAQAYRNFFCWANFPRCDEEDKSLMMCRSVCENYFKACGYAEEMWRCESSALLNGIGLEDPLLFKEGLELDVEGYDENGTQYFLRSFFPGQPFRANQFEEDEETPIVVCTPSLKNDALSIRARHGFHVFATLVVGLARALLDLR
ncbi:Glyoxysomal processing protease, glyoxysomal [Hondaea fermentalgiana]|uniref:Glyoxysomal processing protease, glyoxysomal n=1 Tax=Hondaea fermentalgiana TaxID=2315210 RepID=A0A2R5FYG3_9STRA|nr:Glyoxysomal processing protease, glyoxysomal [Hondaea fermentalgiana]|eukprot:GBG23797.1 Glyoxysomal processing protease, glyoxysomal [Hondaea fermentalgiana]